MGEGAPLLFLSTKIKSAPSPQPSPPTMNPLVERGPHFAAAATQFEVRPVRPEAPRDEFTPELPLAVRYAKRILC